MCVGRLVFPTYEDVPKDVHEGSQQVVCYSAGRGGGVALVAVAARMEVQTVWGHLLARVPVLLGLGG